MLFRSARLEANATTRGDGGTVVVWSDQATRFAGSIEARGGAEGGDGGTAEVSGRQQLGFRGKANLTAAKGRTGTLLLDPATLSIIGGNGDGDLDGSATFGTPVPGTIAGGDPLMVVFEGEIEALDANIVLQATDSISVHGSFSNNDINVKPGNSISLTVAGGSGYGLIDLVTPPSGSGSPVAVPISIQTSGGGNIDLRVMNPVGGEIRVGEAHNASSLNAGTTGNVTVQDRKSVV